MDVKEAIEKRRAYRSLEHIEITDELLKELTTSAKLAPSCFNNQPWRYIFVYNEPELTQTKEALSKGNEWAYDASMIIVVFSDKDDDCIIKNRQYYLFDTGLATAQMILRATDLGLVAHPIAGFSPKKTKEKLNIPDNFDIISFIIVGKHSKRYSNNLSQKQIDDEKNRPIRKPFSEFIYYNKFLR